MMIRFWGTRGSIPSPGPHTVKYGGNTSCLELRFGPRGRMAIIDAGTGIRQLGKHLLHHEDLRNPTRLDIFLSHTHWDHIMGFPFFAPMYMPGVAIRIHGPASCESNSLEKALRGQFASRYFPVSMENLESDIRFVELYEGIFDLGDNILLATKYLNHPIRCLGYRFEYDGRSVVTLFDMEHAWTRSPEGGAGRATRDAPAHPETGAWRRHDALLEQFYADADVVICDAQYTAEEYRAGKSGRGHSAMEDVVESCRRNGVRRLALTHHDPDRTDEEIDDLAARICGLDTTGKTEVFFAYEGMEIVL